MSLTQKELQETIYVANAVDRCIDEMTYEDYLYEYGADECTSPSGVAPRIHVREKERGIYRHIDNGTFLNDREYSGMDTEEQEQYEYFGEETYYEVWSWGVRGNNPYNIDQVEYETEEEAELSVCEHFEHYVSSNDNAPHCCHNKAEAIEDLAMMLNKSEQVVERYLSIFQS